MKIKYTLLLACILLAACSPQTQTTPSSTELVPDDATEAQSYEALSPWSIRTESGVLIELTRPRIENDPVKGWFFDFEICYTGLSNAQIPQAEAGDVDSPLIADLQFFRSEEELPLEMAVIGRGSSQGTMDGMSQICENQFYQFPADVVAGQAEEITALVTFHEMFGIAEPVRYEMNVVPLQGMFSPIGDLPDQGAETLSYEVLSPESIRTQKGIRIDIREDTRIAIDPIMGTTINIGFRFSKFAEDQIPESDPQTLYSFLIQSIQFFRGEDEIPLNVEQVGSGGGLQPAEDGTIIISQSEEYQLPSDFTLGQAERIVALVTFDESLGITEPVRFILELTPIERPLG